MLRRWFAGRPKKLVEGDMCGVPGCGRKAFDQWRYSSCALREAGIKPEWVKVCRHHDFALNSEMIRILFGAKYEKQIAAYKKKVFG